MILEHIDGSSKWGWTISLKIFVFSTHDVGEVSEQNDRSNPSSDDSEVSLWGYCGRGAGESGDCAGMMMDTLWVNGWVELEQKMFLTNFLKQVTQQFASTVWSK